MTPVIAEYESEITIITSTETVLVFKYKRTGANPAVITRTATLSTGGTSRATISIDNIRNDANNLSLVANRFADDDKIPLS